MLATSANPSAQELMQFLDNIRAWCKDVRSYKPAGAPPSIGLKGGHKDAHMYTIQSYLRGILIYMYEARPQIFQNVTMKDTRPTQSEIGHPALTLVDPDQLNQLF